MIEKLYMLKFHHCTMHYRLLLRVVFFYVAHRPFNAHIWSVTQHPPSLSPLGTDTIYMFIAMENAYSNY